MRTLLLLLWRFHNCKKVHLCWNMHTGLPDLNHMQNGRHPKSARCAMCFVCLSRFGTSLVGWLVGFLTSSSQQLGYIVDGPQDRASDNFTCCNTRDRAGRPWLLSQPVTLYWHRPNQWGAGGHSGNWTRNLLTRSRVLYRRATAPPLEHCSVHGQDLQHTVLKILH